MKCDICGQPLAWPRQLPVSGAACLPCLRAWLAARREREQVTAA